MPFFLIRHPEGDIVVDEGNPLAVAVDAHAHWGVLADQFRCRDGRGAAPPWPSCAEIVIPPESVSHLVQSHLHIDHTGALGHLPGATVIVQAQELDAARAAEPPQAQALFARTSIRSDSTGDPLKANWISSATGRSAYSRHRAIPRATCRCCFNWTRPAPSCSRRTPRTIAPNGMDSYDRALSIRAMMPSARWNVLRELARETDSLVVFGHDPDNWSRLRHAPDHYA